MDLRNLPEQLSSSQRINQRRTIIERELGIPLHLLTPADGVIGESEKVNCEQMFGMVPIPVGYVGPMCVHFSNNTRIFQHVPVATTEGALIASMNRGAKATSTSGIIMKQVIHRGITRSIAFTSEGKGSVETIITIIRKHEAEWKAAAEATSHHLKILHYDIDLQKKYVFLTIAADTDEAMGMNMITIAADAIAATIVQLSKDIRCVTIAGNVDSDKKPSKRTHDRGRGFDIVCTAEIREEEVTSVLKTTSEALLSVADAKLKAGSIIAGAIGQNLHASNIVAGIYLATGQDPAHVVEGSLTDTTLTKTTSGIQINIHAPAILVGVRGGGANMPAQTQARNLLLSQKSGLRPKQQLAETIAAAILCGELSLLAAQASHTLASSHAKLAR